MTWDGLEPIAIVGMGCRMPGDVRSSTDLWKLVMSKTIANTGRVPDSRFNIDAYLHPSNDRPGSFNVPGGYFLNDDPEAFDTGMFNISRVEALCMDPQQRKLLEVVFEAFESSGTTLETVASRRTGCFVGTFTQDFLHMATKEPDFRPLYTAVGVDVGMLANRISYLYDLRGPSLTVNTACSSTMYALHLACQALRSGDCDGAIVGGSQLILTADQQMNTARMGVLSPTNQCHTFDEAADGYGRAEGVGALYVRPLSLAIRDGDPIRAVIRSSATGSGKSQDSIVHPSVEAQMDVIVTAYKQANLLPDETTYIECHGTGTQIGDPIEIDAIHRAMHNSGHRFSPILVGSLKPNVGHSEASSSIGTIIKSVLALEKGIIPPTAGLRRLNPKIPWNDLNVKVITEPTVWPRAQGTTRRIGINAFGYGGTNSHAIFENAEAFVPQTHSFIHSDGPSSSSVEACDQNLEYASGRISAGQAIVAGYFRGKVAASLRADGAMLAVGLGADELSRTYLHLQESPWHGRVVVACHNSPQSATLSGDADAIAGLSLALQNDNVFHREVKTGGRAYHSHHMTEAATTYAQLLSQASLVPLTSPRDDNPLPNAAMYSTVKAAELSRDGISNTYWAENLSSPVLFAQAVDLMLTSKPEVNTVIEIGPHSALAGPLRQILQAQNKVEDVKYLCTLKRGEHDGIAMLKLAGNLWARNASVDMQAIVGMLDTCTFGTDGTESLERHSPSLVVDLPPYHWTYSTPCWSENRASREQRQLQQPRHDILGRRIAGLSALEPTWRNILRQKDLPWLCDHRLGGEVMLPGTGYLALAFEAMTQIIEEAGEPVQIESYTIRNVVFLSATVVPDDDAGTETMFRMRKVEGKSSDNYWHEFVASCCSYGKWKDTAKGIIGINAVSSRQLRNPSVPAEPKSPWRKTKHINWLKKLRSVGVDQGPAFHHIDDIEYAPDEFVARAEMPIATSSGTIEAESRYVLHPTVLDSTLQPSMATIHRGDFDALRCGTIPTHIHEATLIVPSEEQLGNRCRLQVWTPPPLGNRAFATRVRLTAHDGSALLDLSGRHVFYRAAVPHELRGPANRDLYLREEFKVDADYMSGSTTQSFESTLDLLLHKLPQASSWRTLCLDPALLPAVLAARPWVNVMMAAPSENIKVEIASQYGDNGRVKILVLDINSPATWQRDHLKGSYDLVISSSSVSSEQEVFQRIVWILAPNGRLIQGGNNPAWTKDLISSAGVSRASIQTMPDGSILATKREASGAVQGYESDNDLNNANGTNGAMVSRNAEISSVLIVHSGECSSSILDALRRGLEHEGWIISTKSMTDLVRALPAQQNHERVVIIDDDSTGGALLEDIDDEKLRVIIGLTESASYLTWVTRGGLLNGDFPGFATARGAARSIRIERIFRLDLVTVDHDGEDISEKAVTGLVADILRRQAADGQNGETEYCVEGGAVHIGRVVPHAEINAKFVPDSGDIRAISLSEEPDLAVRGRLDEATGALGYYRDDNKAQLQCLAPDEVVVHVQAIGLTDFDGADDSGVLSHQFAGTVIYAGHHAVQLFPAGSRVAGFASHFNGGLGTFQRSTSNLIFTLEGQDATSDMAAAATIPSAFATAIYALEDLARVEPGENVVLFDGVGAIGLAAIQICGILGANIIVITSSPITHRFLDESGHVGPHCRVLRWGQEERNDGESLRDLLHDAFNAVGGEIDAILSSTSLGEASVLENFGPWLSSSARIVAVGPALGKGGMANRNVLLSSMPANCSLSFFQFELRDIAERRPRTLTRIVERCGQLYREGSVRAISPINILNPDEVFKSAVPGELGSGMHVLSYSSDKASFPVISPRLRKPRLQFKPDALYLLVGCLGGIGSAIALWMAERGARHLAFLSRSGTGTPAAATTVKMLEARGVKVVVLCADIMDYNQVVHAIKNIRSRSPSLPPIRGVLNAAGITRDRVLSNMTASAWHQVAHPKVQGSLNLHKALLPAEDESPAMEIQGKPVRRPDLDFFVMTSSVAGACGSAGQANYTSANAVMDALARHRRARNLPAVSIILPAIFGIGWVAERPELERWLRGKGMYGIREEEMLNAFELAMMPQSEKHDAVGDHIIVGIQPRRGEATIREAGVDVHWLKSPRFRWLQMAMEEQSGNSPEGKAVKSGRNQNIISLVREAGNRDLAISA
ncbi:hypothetical protein diail_9721, partial [Diaporthe ilicicola]